VVVIILLLSISIYVLDLDNLFIAAKGYGECIIIVFRGKMNSEIYITHEKLYIYIYYIFIYDIIVNAGDVFVRESPKSIYPAENTAVCAHIDYN